MTTANRHFSGPGAALFLLCLAVAAPAAGADRVSSSTGHLLGAGDGSDAVVFTVADGQAKTADKYLPDGAPASKPRDAAQSRSLNHDFWIYDARTVLYFDYDYDGFYSGLDVVFDADTYHLTADVYARLYLSLEGGPWIPYYTTDVFTIIGASGIDDYVIETDLIEGYPTGYYDVLIELYDYEYDEHVASFGPFDSSSLSALPLEDEARDAGFVAPPVPPVSHSSGGGGSTGLLLVLMGSLTLLLRRHPGKPAWRRSGRRHVRL